MTYKTGPMRAMLAVIEPCMDRWFNHWSADAITIRTFIAASPALLDTIDAQAAELAQIQRMYDDMCTTCEVNAKLASERASMMVAKGLSMAADIAEHRAEERFAELGITEPDTNWQGYTGRHAEHYEALDEECKMIAAAIRALIARAQHTGDTDAG